MRYSVKRDPFSHGEYIRFSESGKGKTCNWCGQTKRTLYAYQWEDDDKPNRPQWNHKLYCNFECFAIDNRI